MKIRILTAILVCAISASPSNALPPVDQAETSILAVKNQCGFPETWEGYEYAKGWCWGFIEAAYTAMEDWCVPGNTTRRQVHEFVVAQLEKYSDPEVSVYIDAVPAIQAAIAAEWPCG